MTVANTWKAFLQGTRLDRYDDGSQKGLKPLWTINLEDDEDVLQWHRQNFNAMEDIHNARTSMYMRNRDIYAGLHSNSRGRAGIIADPMSEWGTARFRMPEVVVNHSFELTEQIVSKLSRFSTTVDVFPVNGDEGDRSKARAAQRFTGYLSEINDIKGMFIRLIRDSRIGGEAYIIPDYDEEAGDLTPDARRAKDLGIRVPLKDENGEAVIGQNGEPLFIEEMPRVGEITYRLRSVPEVLVQPKAKWRDVEWFCEIDLVDIDELKRTYPNSTGILGETPLVRDSSDSSQETAEVVNEVFRYTYWHKKVPALDSGRKIVCVENGVLYNDVHPFSGAPLNIIRLTDIDIEGELHGWSFLNNLIIPQLILNKLYTLWYKNIALGSHLYWLVPANARIARDKIRNSASVIQYFGTQKPEIAVFRTVSADLLNLVDKMEQRMLTVSRVQQTSRGELPPNVEAGVAISILEEQENQAMTPDIKKVNAAVEKLFKLSLGIAGDKYDKDDGRTARILGKEGEFLLEQIDQQKLSGPYDVKVKKATAFSQSKPIMMREITQLEAMRPGFLSNEELYDLLDLGDRDKFYDITTAARRAAEAENERMKDGGDVPEPTRGEFLLVHWDSHMTVMQSPSFKLSASKEVKELFEDHITYTEFLLMEKAKTNIKLAQSLAALEYFPAFYTPRIALPQIILALGQGQVIPPETALAPPAPLTGPAPTDLQPEDLPIEGEEGVEEPLPEEGAVPTQGIEPTGPTL